MDALTVQKAGNGEGLTDSRDSGDDLAELELVEDGRLSGGIESDHEDTHLLLAEEAGDYVAPSSPHQGACRGGGDGQEGGMGKTWRVRCEMRTRTRSTVKG